MGSLWLRLAKELSERSSLRYSEYFNPDIHTGFVRGEPIPVTSIERTVFAVGAELSTQFTKVLSFLFWIDIPLKKAFQLSDTVTVSKQEQWLREGLGLFQTRPLRNDTGFTRIT